MDFTHELIIRSIKIIDLGFIAAIYILLGFIVAKLMDKIEGSINRERIEKKPFYRIVLELILFFWLVGIIWYFIRNIVPLIPFPLDGIFGYDHLKVKELHSATLFAIMLLFTSKNYKFKVDHLYYNM
jgi:hypothetical protein